MKFAGLLMHAETSGGSFWCWSAHHQCAAHPPGADDIDPSTFDNGISDDIFEKIVPASGWQFRTRA